MSSVPGIRISGANERRVVSEGEFVLYWMAKYRRLHWNFALQHAADLARNLSKPLIILELLRADYPYASHRFHRFVLDGMPERSRSLEGGPVFHYPFIERDPGEGEGLLLALGPRACAVVADDYPSAWHQRKVREAASRLDVRVDLVDSNGLLPLRAADRAFTAAYHFRRFLQKNLPEHLGGFPARDPLKEGLVPGREAVGHEVLLRWPPSAMPMDPADMGEFPVATVDPTVRPVDVRGGEEEARTRLRRFIRDALHRYDRDRNHPDAESTSGLSPYLHFGVISAHEIFSEVAGAEGWTPLRLSQETAGARAGWWGMSPGAEAFLDQLVTWRELGFNMAWQMEKPAAYESLPAWARATLEEHEKDPRAYLYSYAELRDAETHDPVWNAAQRQLSTDGVIHNYLRMLWGKKILEWTPSGREALEILIDLNDRLALDGRDPNSYSGIMWCLGRYDRGWPERPVFGKVRSMSSERTAKKVKLDEYLKRYGTA